MYHKVWIWRDLIKSEVFRSLNNTSIIVYLDFLSKCQWKQDKSKKKGRDGAWYIANNGQITYPYTEAAKVDQNKNKKGKDKEGITPTRFVRAIDELVEKGFIDIVHSGSGGMKGDKSKYAISDRWRKYGQLDFIEKKRSKDTRGGRGWAAYWAKKKLSPKMNSKIIHINMQKDKGKTKHRYFA